MVVEDERLVGLMLASMLRLMGYEVAGVAPSGEAALASLQLLGEGGALPDMVLLDVYLAEGIDGIATAKRIREQSGVPCIFLTAYSDAATMEHMQQAGPKAILIKPVDMEALREALAQAFDVHDPLGA